MQSKEMIDFHAHILPGADHGCSSREVCAKQLEAAKECGINTIVAVAHFYPHMHRIEEFISLRENALTRMDTLGDKYKINIVPGAEVQLCIGLDKMEGIEKLCVGNTKVMLVEIPDMPLSEEMYDTLKKLGRRFDVLIAHADRYLKSVTDRLIEEKYMLQINARSLLNVFSRKRTLEILESGLVYAIGSDIHGPDRKAYSQVKKFLKIAGDRYGVIQKRMCNLLDR